jgi:predicted transcriptional regulator
MTSKEEILAMIRSLPEDVTIEDVMAALAFRQKVDRGLRELDTGKVIPHAEAKQRLRKWLERR